MSKKAAYVSYTRRADYSFIPTLKEAAKNSDWEIKYDEIAPGTNRSISAFTKELSEGEQIIFLLSAQYFESPYCVDELLFSYNKRAKDLLPVVVFATEDADKEIKPEDICQHREKKSNKEKADQLRLAIAWLLGQFDTEKDNWDTLFKVVDNQPDDVAKSVIQSLDFKPKNYIKIKSNKEKITTTKDVIEQIITEINDSDLSGILANYPRAGELINAEELVDKFLKVAKWVEKLESRKLESLEVDRCIPQVKKLISALILLAIDDRAINECIHWLNRAQDDAALLIREITSISLQTVVSAITNSGVYFDYARYSKPALYGTGELVLHERGICNKNHYDKMKEETNWKDLKNVLGEQLFREIGSPGEITVAGINTMIKLKGSYYLLFTVKITQVGDTKTPTN